MHGSAERLQVRRIGRNRGHLWEQLDLPLWLARNGRPPLVSLCNTAPLIYRNQIATHHDITYVRHPESYSRTFRGAYKSLTPLLLKRIKALITVSDFSRKEIARYYGYPREHLCGTQCRVGEVPPTRPGNQPPAGRPYLLAVSSPNAHKNFARMVAAFLSLEGFDEWSCTSSATPTRCSPATTTGRKAILAYACSAASTTSSWCANTRAPPRSSFRRSTKASAYRRWRRRPVAAR